MNTSPFLITKRVFFAPARLQELGHPLAYRSHRRHTTQPINECSSTKVVLIGFRKFPYDS